ncbi:MAG: hypothetical protein HYZ28_18355 [Myxococcales bacterium]|nr:hypothetical protein [Myxococcales bacterium]
MLATLVVVASLGASPFHLASPGFTAVNVSDKEAEFFSDYFAQQVIRHGGVKITTKNEIVTLLGLERQREMLGCADQGGSSCIAELAGALGAEGVITGTVAKLGGGFAVTLKIILAKNAQELSSDSGQFSDEPAVLSWLQEVADEVSFTLTGRRPPGRFKRTAKYTALGGAGLVVLGGVAYGLAWSNYNRLKTFDDTIRSEAEMRSIAAQGRVLAPVGVGLAGAGVAALLAAGGLWLFGEGSANSAGVAVVATGDSGALIFSGEF